ncbi:hypothetical protein MKZ38_006075 [Zalerion maritima]|uniref:Uncharacterized protein n=1 Tax=Zalerion maritima TaxID=339359 RepID=A0AAD5WU11_9PEZI|nr:hypothetical protein MKZ38_006075 [Zalerion maritima]
MLPELDSQGHPQSLWEIVGNYRHDESWHLAIKARANEEAAMTDTMAFCSRPLPASRSDSFRLDPRSPPPHRSDTRGEAGRLLFSPVAVPRRLSAWVSPSPDHEDIWTLMCLRRCTALHCKPLQAPAMHCAVFVPSNPSDSIPTGQQEPRIGPQEPIFEYYKMHI